jgi:F0F1-type ATP synthase alpha subunit
MDRDVSQVRSFLDGFTEYLRMKHPDILEGIAKTGAISMEAERALASAADTYKSLVR